MQILDNDSAGLIKDATTATFMADVVEASMSAPVIVDFWAPWCGPCKQLGPVLEKLVRAAAGAVRLVKVNIDDSPEIAQQMRIQSIPAVFAFSEGRPVDGFTGALPESQIKEFIQRLTGGTAADAGLAEVTEEANAMLAAQDWNGAASLFSQVLQHDPKYIPAHAGMLKALIGLAEFDSARAMIDNLSDEMKKDREVQAAIAQLELADAGAAAGDIDGLRRTVEARPQDPAARFDLAMALYGRRDSQGAVDQLLESVRLDRNWNDDASRKQLLKLFEAFGNSDPLTVRSRKRLSSILFS